MEDEREAEALVLRQFRWPGRLWPHNHWQQLDSTAYCLIISFMDVSGWGDSKNKIYLSHNYKKKVLQGPGALENASGFGSVIAERPGGQE